MLDDVASQRYSVIEAQCLIGGLDGLVAGLDELVDLLLGVAAGFGEENLGALDGGCLDLVVAVTVIDAGNIVL